MEPQSLLYLIIGVFVFEYVLEQVLDFINLRSRNKAIPLELKGYYDETKYKKSRKYHKESAKFSFISSGFSFLLSFFVLISGVFGQIDTLLQSYFENEILLSLAFFGLVFIVSDIMTTPFQVYSTFVIEERFGFNKTTVKTFIMDKLKGYLLTAMLGGIILSLLLYLINSLGTGFWIYFWLVIALVILLVNMFYTSLILPIFNKLTPLKDGELKDAIQQYSRSVSFPLDNIFVIDGSKRSNKANAFFSGIGKKKKIVLYDTLIDNHTTEELVAVLAHEVGHFKKKHIIFGYILSVIQVGIMLYILSLMVFNEQLSVALGASKMGVHLNLLAFGILYTPISKITGILMQAYSRKNEFEADGYAAKTYNGDHLQSALKKLSVDSLSNLYPHPVYVFFNYSHPPLLKRLKALSEANP